jgi:hypothetical protein
MAVVAMKHPLPLSLAPEFSPMSAVDNASSGVLPATAIISSTVSVVMTPPLSTTVSDTV